MADKKRAVLVTKDILKVGDDHAVTLFVWLIANANRDKEPYPYKVTHPKSKETVTINLQQNQVFLCAAAYAEARGVSPKVVRTRLNQLKRRASIGLQEVHQLGSIVTVINLDQYQTFANYKNGPGSSREAVGNDEVHLYHLDNHVDKSNTARARFDFERDVLTPFPKERRTNPTAAAHLFRELDDDSKAAVVVAVPQYAEWFATVHKDDHRWVPGLHSFVKNGVYAEGRATWETRIKTRVPEDKKWGWG